MRRGGVTMSKVTETETLTMDPHGSSYAIGIIKLGSRP